MYILAHNFIGEKYYVRVNDNNTWDEVYDPGFATSFITVNDAINWSKENTTFGEYAKALEQKRTISLYKKWVDKGTIRRTFDLVDKSISRAYKGESPEEVLKWWISIRNKEDQGVKFEDYKTWPDLYSIYKHIWSQRSYYLDNNQNKLGYTFELYTGKNSSLEEFKQELNLILPFVEYKDKKGYKLFPIFDYQLSQYESVTFCYKNENDCFINGSYSEKIRGDLKKVFDYWKKERWYKDDDNNDELED